MKGLTILVGDCRSTLRTLAPESVDCVVTSPPYFGLRDYGVDGQIGREPSLKEYVAALVDTFAALRPALKPTGTVWLNLGDCYAGSGAGSAPARSRTRTPDQLRMARAREGAGRASLKPKDLMMVPATVAIALRDDGWWLRSHIVWAKPRPMPESVRDRPTATHEEIFLLTKQGAGYFYEDPGLPVSDASIAKGMSAARVLAKGFDHGVTPKYEGTATKAGSGNSQEKHWQRFAAYAPDRKYADGAGRGRANTLDSRDAHQERTARVYGRARPETMHSPEGRRAVDASKHERPTRRLRNAEQAPPPDVWWINPAMYPGAHFATFPPELVERCLAAGCPPGPDAVVLDPFGGAGTTALVALHTGRQAVLCELSEEYAELARRRVESGGRLDSDMRRQRHAERKRAEQEAHGQGSLI